MNEYDIKRINDVALMTYIQRYYMDTDTMSKQKFSVSFYILHTIHGNSLERHYQVRYGAKHSHKQEKT